jgi:hypothetical protein
MNRNSIIVISVLLIIGAGGWYFLRGNNESPVKVGGDKDAHGCIGSAGYTWSEMKGECIRLFEAGIRLNPKDDALDQTQSAFVVFKSATVYKSGELYLPGNQVAIGLVFQNGKWSDKEEKYKLFEQNKELFLIGEDNKLKYATADPK